MQKILYFINTQHNIPPFLFNEILAASSFFDKIILISPIFDKKRCTNLPSNVLIKSTCRLFYYFSLFGGFIFNLNKIARDDWRYAKGMKKASFNYFLMRVKHASIALFLRKRLDKAIKRHGSGPVISSWLDSGSLAVALSKNHKTFISCSFCHSFEVDQTKNRYVGLLFTNFVINRLGHVVFISENVMNGFIHFALENKISYSCSFLVRKLGIRHEMVHDCSLAPHTGTNIISCSTLTAVKRIDLIIEVLKNVTDNINWTHIGSGPLEDEIKKQARSLPNNINFNFLGHLENEKVLSYYQINAKNIDLFINLSSVEGIPVSIMEAMSYGIPCIATNVGGTNELVNNSNGFLIDNNDVINKTIFSIKKYITSDKITVEKLRKSAQEKIKKEFILKNNTNRFYKKLIKDAFNSN
ncbi:MAG: glycosyltransferase [Bacilli bacterium]|nr:glycosyltransferase [Bacilli bacterium]